MLQIALNYSIKWRYSYNDTKTVAMIWGKDKDQNTAIVMGHTSIEVSQNCKHMGVTLSSSRTQQKQFIDKRINSARASLLAARGLGSVQVPMSPAVLSKLYWSVSIPKLTYGLDVMPLDHSDMAELEKAHRSNAKLVQGLPSCTPNPAPLAALGWISLASYISMIRIMFMLRTLCTKDGNIYKEIMIMKIKEFFIKWPVKIKRKSPVMAMIEAAKEYGLYGMIHACIEKGNFGSIDEWKKIVKENVWKNEVIKWNATCSMYRELNMYASSVKDIKLHSWWILSKVRPHLTKKISCVMSLLMGTQPPGLMCNFGSRVCNICYSGSTDNSEHILFTCHALETTRKKHLAFVLYFMPMAMRQEYIEFDLSTKNNYLLSGLLSEFIPEWECIYRAILSFVWHMYSERKIIYDSYEQ